LSGTGAPALVVSFFFSSFIIVLLFIIVFVQLTRYSLDADGSRKLWRKKWITV